ncbi:SH3 domain-containing protein [Mycena kentingensis (nom. inval.)]|nr:SH3 domain-containing protein [Mycena kentingensis (nom. inval.)]
MKHILVFASLVSVVYGAVYTVGVGKDETTGKKGKGFDPSSIHPAAGDTIVFEFRGGSHSAVQSSFANPCTSNGGFNSGVQTVDDNLEVDAPGLPTVSLLVNDTQPLWFFDEAGGLCSEGAVLSVNPSATETDAQFKANAAKAPAASPSSASADAAGTSTTASDSAGVSATSEGPTTPTGAALRLGVSGYAALAGLAVGLL